MPWDLPRRPGRVRSFAVAGVAGAVLSGLVGIPSASAVPHWAIGLSAASRAQAKAENAPAAPTGVSAACQGVLLNNNVVVSWSNVTHASAYQVYDSSTSGGTYTAVGSTWPSSPATIPLGAGTYFFKVRAIGGSFWTGPLSAASPSSVTVAVVIVSLLCS